MVFPVEKTRLIIGNLYCFVLVLPFFREGYRFGKRCEGILQFGDNLLAEVKCNRNSKYKLVKNNYVGSLGSKRTRNSYCWP